MDRAEIEELFAAEGLSMLGLVDLGPEPSFPQFASWLSEGRQAGMHFLEQNQHLRADPRALLPDGAQAIIFSLNYFQGDQLQAARRGVYKFAQYARLRDYHRTMRAKAQRILLKLQALRPGLLGRVTVDSAPLLERALAARTAEGFIGKNTCYIHPRRGSFFLLGEIILNMPCSDSDQPAAVVSEQRQADGGCGSCRRCQVNCPTGALDRAYSLDARKCLAYWTIEHRGPIPFTFWPWLKTYVFGCDLCQLACPYNRQSALTTEPLRIDPKQIDLLALASMSQEQYVDWFGGSPLTRAKRSGLRRNALIAMTVGGDQRLEAAIASVLCDDEEVLQETVMMIKKWKLGEIAGE